jgi:DNA primase
VFNLYQAGFENICALMGSKLSEHQEKLILDATDRVILMFDNDEAGQECTRDVLQRLIKKIYVRIAELPSGKTQPDQLEVEEIKNILGS